MKNIIFNTVLLFSILFIGKELKAQGPYELRNTFSPNTFPYIVDLVPCSDGSSRLFVVCQRGKVWIVNTSNPSAPAKLFLDISDIVSQTEPETGLLSIAFHPNYSGNKYFYVSYTTTTGINVTSYISRFNVSPVNPDSALRSSELNLVSLPQPFENHNGGKIAFGPDNYLYIAFGDGGSGGDPGNRAQNRAVIYGKMLRIDINSATGGLQYSIPPTNPYFGNISGYREEIWCYGLRNPWKYSWDSQNGRLWCGDVGQDIYEEIDTLVNGGNYGWRVMEGFHCYNPATGCDMSGKILPLFEYDHNGTGYSITGGFVYRGNYMPALVGKYIFADFSLGKIWALSYPQASAADTIRILTMPGLCSTFGTDLQKNIYACLYSDSGKVLKIVDTQTGIGNIAQLPEKFNLKQNYPNPFNPATKINYELPQRILVNLIVYDVTGKEISELVNREQNAGYYEINFNSTGLPSGVYYYRITAGEFTETKKMVILK